MNWLSARFSQGHVKKLVEQLANRMGEHMLLDYKLGRNYLSSQWNGTI